VQDQVVRYLVATTSFVLWGFYFARVGREAQR